MNEKERDPMPGKQSDQEGRNAPDPGEMPEEFVDDGPGNRFGPTPPPDDDEPREDNLNQGA